MGMMPGMSAQGSQPPPQMYMQAPAPLPPPPGVQSALAMGITQPARMLMPYNMAMQPFDAEAQQQFIAEHCVDAVFGFNPDSPQQSPVSA